MTERELLEQLLNEVKELKASQNEMKIAQYDISERLDAINMKCDITRWSVESGRISESCRIQRKPLWLSCRVRDYCPKHCKAEQRKAAVRKIYFLYCGLSLLCFMELRGIEPLSENLSIAASPITVISLTFPPSDAK